VFEAQDVYFTKANSHLISDEWWQDIEGNFVMNYSHQRELLQGWNWKIEDIQIIAQLGG